MPSGIFERTAKHRTKVGKKIKKLWTNPEYRSKQSKVIQIAMNRLEVRAKISRAGKGRKAWNKGIPMSSETKLKLSKSIKENFKNPEFYQKFCERQKRTMSNPQVRKRISESNKGQIAWNKGIPCSESTKQKISEKNKGKTAWNKGTKGLQVPWNKGKTGVYTQETKDQISKSLQGNVPWNKDKTGIYSEETIEKMRVGSEDNWADPTLRSHLNGMTFRDHLQNTNPWFSHRRYPPTVIEMKFYAELIRRGFLDFIPEYRIDIDKDYIIIDAKTGKRRRWFKVDGYIFPNIIVECDGYRYHSKPVDVENDRRRDIYLRSKGYKILRFTETDIHRDLKSIGKQIIDFLG